MAAPTITPPASIADTLKASTSAKHSVSVVLTVGNDAWVRNLAQNTGSSLSAVINEALRRYRDYLAKGKPI